eukprot:5212564-Amphidinium_carterae.1
MSRIGIPTADLLAIELNQGTNLNDKLLARKQKLFARETLDELNMHFNASLDDVGVEPARWTVGQKGTNTEIVLTAMVASTTRQRQIELMNDDGMGFGLGLTQENIRLLGLTEADRVRFQVLTVANNARIRSPCYKVSVKVVVKDQMERRAVLRADMEVVELGVNVLGLLGSELLRLDRDSMRKTLVHSTAPPIYANFVYGLAM